MPKYLSGRVKRTPQGSLTTDRYQFLGLEQTEPNIGDPPEFDPLPSGTQYQIVSFVERPGERFWVPVGGGIIPGALTIRDEGLIIPRTDANPNLGINSITDIDFVGAAITAVGFLNPDGSPGTAVTVTISAPGENHGVIFNNDGEFATSPYFTFDNSIGIGSVGIGTSNPTQNLHVVGNVKLDRTIYGEDNQPGNAGDLLIKTATGGVKWVDNTSVETGAAGTYTQVQFHDATGLLGGAPNFVFDFTNNRIGIGSTQPDRLLDVLGEARFTGIVTFVDDVVFEKNVSIAGTLTYEDVTNVDAIGIITARSGIDINSAGLNVDAGISTFNDDVKFVTNNGNNILFDKSLNKLTFGDDVQAMFGDSEDLKIYHSSNQSYIQDTGQGNLNLDTNGFSIKLTSDNSNTMLRAKRNQSVELYWNNSKKLETSGVGVTIFGKLDTTNLSVTGFSTFTNNIDANGDLDVDGTANLDDVDIDGDLDVDGHTELDNLNVSGITTLSGNAEFQGSLTTFGGTGTGAGNGGAPFAIWAKANNYLWFSDDTRILMGFSQTLEIKSSGSESIIRDTRAGVAGTLAIGADKLILRNKDGNEPYLEANDNGSVKLYHDFLPRFETSGLGVTVYGTGTDSTIDLSTNDNTVRGKIFADSSDNIGFKDKGGDWNVKCLDDAAVELYYDTTKRIETLVDGGKVTGKLEITEKVGIGTDDPDQELHVMGQIKVDAGAYARVEYARDDTNLWSVGLRDTDDFFFFRESGAGNVIFQQGNIGIGTTSPNAKLDVNVGSSVTAFNIEGTEGQLFSVTNNLSSGSIFAVNDISGTPSINVDADGTIQLAPFLASDKIGIGTTNPQSKLDVFGDTRLGDLFVTGISTFNGAVGVADSIFHIGDTDTQMSFGTNEVKFITAGSQRVLIDSTGDLLPGTNEQQNLGSGTLRWNILYVKEVNASGGSIVVDNYSTNNLEVSGFSTFVGFAEFQGSVSIAGTLTYEDVTNIDAIGIITARSGINITSGGLNVVGIATFDNDLIIPEFIYHAGDLNTKFGFPTSDTISFETAGSERVRIDSSGRIIQNYDALPSVASNLPYAYFAPAKQTYGGVDLTMNLHDDASNALGNGGGVGFSANNSNGDPIVRGAIRGNTESTSTNAGYLTFYTRPASGSNEERVRITSDGKVGIGTDDPTAPLVVRSSDNTLGILTSTDDGANLDLFDNDTQSRIRTVDGQLQFRADVGNAVADSSIRFFVDGANEKVRITSDGKVGINSTSPTHELEVLGDTSLKGNLKVSGISTFNDDIDFIGVPVGSAQTSIQFHKGDGTNQNLDTLRLYESTKLNVGTGATGGFVMQGNYNGAGPTYNSYILTRGDNFFIDGGTSTSIKIRTQFARNAIIANSDNGGSGTVELYHSSGGTATKKFETSGLGVTVYGTVDATQLNASGIITSTGADINGDLDVDGRSELDITNISETLNVSGISTFGNNVIVENGSLEIKSVSPTLIFNDTTGTPDYKIRKQSGNFIIMETTQTNDTEYRLSIRNGGLVDIPGDLNVDGNVSIGGTLTYEDVTNVDAIGLITARNGIHVLSQGIVVNGSSNNSASTDANDVVVGTINDVNTGISILGNASTGVGRIMFSDGVGSFNQGSIEYRHADDSMRFSTSTLSDRLTILGNGNVGIGTDVVPQKLNVKGTISMISGASQTQIVNISQDGSNNGNIIVNDSSGTTRVKLDSVGDSFIRGGSVGIGSVNPAYTLDFGESSSTIRLVSNNDGTAIRMGAGGSGNNFTLLRVDGQTDNHDGESNSGQYGFSLKYMGSRSGNDNSLSLFSDNQNNASQIEAITVLQDGKIGIGKTIPGTQLHFNESSSTIRLVTSNNATAIRIGSGGNGNDVTLLRVDGSSANHDGESDDSANGFSFKYMGSGAGNDNRFSICPDDQAATQFEAFTVLQDGKIGIGTTIPGTLLHINGSAATEKLITLSSGPNKRNNYIGVNGADNLEIAADEDGQGGDSSIRFRVDGTEKLRIDSDGDVLITNSANNEGLRVTNNGLNCAIRLRASGSNDNGGFRIDHNAPNSRFLIDRTNAAGEFSSNLIILEAAGHWKPATSNSQDLGSTTNKWDKVYANEFIGEINTTQENLLTENLFVSGISTFVGVSTFYRIGIGTDPSLFIANDLIVGDGQGSRGLTVNSDGTTGRILFADGPTGVDRRRGEVRYDHSADSMRFFTNTTEKLTIDTNGKVGINSTAPEKELDVVGDTSLGGHLNVVGVSTFNSRIHSLNQIDIGSTTSNGRIRFHNGSSYVFTVGNFGGNLTLRSSNGGVKADDNIGRNLFFGSPGGAFRIYHAGNERLSTLGTGVTVFGNTETRTLKVSGVSTFASDVEFQGNVSIGGTLTYEDVTNVDAIGIITARSGIHVLSNGIDVVGISTFDDKVGIGNTVPNATLEVNGPIKTNGGSYTAPHPSGDTMSDAALVIPTESGIYVEHENENLGRYLRNLIKEENGRIELGQENTAIIGEVRVLPGNAGFFSVYNDADEAFRVDSNGRVGIGSASPAYTLDFGESASTIRLNGGGNGTAIRMGAGGASNDFTLIRVDGATDDHDGESDNSNYGFSLKYMGSRTGNDNSLSLFADAEEGTQFEAITVLQDGKVGIKDSTPSYELEVNGTVAATNFDSLSDRRYKTNIQVIENPIEKIMKIDGVSFNWKETNQPSLGVIADNILEVLPEIVSGEDTKSVNYNGLIGLLIETVKDQQKQIDELRGLLDK